MTGTAAGVTILIPAAGRASRMRGRDKLLELVGGRPLIAERALAAAETGAPVFVALPPREQAPARWQALEGLPATPVTVAEPGSGLSASLKAGIAALPDGCTGVLVVLADMPDVTARDISRLLAAFDGETILRATGEDGQPGHPVLFPARDLAALATLEGDQGGREILAREADRLRLVPLPGDHALTDLDTPEDWARWRRR